MPKSPTPAAPSARIIPMFAPSPAPPVEVAAATPAVSEIQHTAVTVPIMKAAPHSLLVVEVAMVVGVDEKHPATVLVPTRNYWLSCRQTCLLVAWVHSCRFWAFQMFLIPFWTSHQSSRNVSFATGIGRLSWELERTGRQSSEKCTLASPWARCRCSLSNSWIQPRYQTSLSCVSWEPRRPARLRTCPMQPVPPVWGWVSLH